MKFVCRICIFSANFDEILSGFRDKFQKRVTCVAFSIKFAKTNQKFAENSEFCEKNSLFSLFFVKDIISNQKVRFPFAEFGRTRAVDRER